MTIRARTYWKCALFGHKPEVRPSGPLRWAKYWCARCHNYPCEKRWYTFLNQTGMNR